MKTSGIVLFLLAIINSITWAADSRILVHAIPGIGVVYVQKRGEREGVFVLKVEGDHSKVTLAQEAFECALARLSNQTVQEVTLHKCGVAACPMIGSAKCSKCKTQFYCSTVCQRADWKAHKPTCVAK